MTIFGRLYRDITLRIGKEKERRKEKIEKGNV
jgi:hypothetical protein